MRLLSSRNIARAFLYSVFLCSFFSESLAQNFADPDKYLVDSLMLQELTEFEKKVIDSCMLNYAEAKTDKDRVEALNFVIVNRNK